jgi:hypothetical protein
MATDTTSGHDASPLTWFTCAVVAAGSIVGGIALIEWIWWLFWVACGMVVLGSVGALFSGIMDNVSAYDGVQSQETNRALVE